MAACRSFPSSFISRAKRARRAGDNPACNKNLMATWLFLRFGCHDGLSFRFTQLLNESRRRMTHTGVRTGRRSRHACFEIVPIERALFKHKLAQGGINREHFFFESMWAPPCTPVGVSNASRRRVGCIRPRTEPGRWFGGTRSHHALRLIPVFEPHRLRQHYQRQPCPGRQFIRGDQLLGRYPYLHGQLDWPAHALCISDDYAVSQPDYFQLQGRKVHWTEHSPEW